MGNNINVDEVNRLTISQLLDIILSEETDVTMSWFCCGVLMVRLTEIRNDVGKVYEASFHDSATARQEAAVILNRIKAKL